MEQFRLVRNVPILWLRHTTQINAIDGQPTLRSIFMVEAMSRHLSLSKVHAYLPSQGFSLFVGRYNIFVWNKHTLWFLETKIFKWNLCMGHITHSSINKLDSNYPYISTWLISNQAFGCTAASDIQKYPLQCYVQIGHCYQGIASGTINFYCSVGERLLVISKFNVIRIMSEWPFC